MGWKSEAFAFKIVSKTAVISIQMDMILTAIGTLYPSLQLRKRRGLSNIFLVEASPLTAL